MTYTIRPTIGTDVGCTDGVCGWGGKEGAVRRSIGGQVVHDVPVVDTDSRAQ